MPGSRTHSLPSMMYGGSCTSRPIPWPVRWMKRSPRPASSMMRRATRSISWAATPGRDRLAGGHLRLAHRLVHPLEPRRRLAHDDRPRRVAEVAAELAAEVHHDGVAGHDRASPGLVVRRCGVRAARHDREVRPRMSVVHQADPRGRPPPPPRAGPRSPSCRWSGTSRRRPGQPCAARRARPRPSPRGGGRSRAMRARTRSPARRLAGRARGSPRAGPRRRRGPRTAGSARGFGVGIDPVDPPDQLDRPHRSDSRRRAGVRAPAPAGRGFPAPQHEQGRPFERHGVVAREVGQVGRGSDHEGIETLGRRLVGGPAHRGRRGERS